MKRQLFYFGVLIVIAALMFLFAYSIVNVGVSIKYETDGGCISLVSGKNLCSQRTFCEIEFLSCLALFITWILFKKKWHPRHVSINFD
jgi:hypothetical protein